MRMVTIGSLQVSQLCIGGNPFSGFSHQNGERDREMIEYHTPDRIKDVLRQAEAAGINTVFARTDADVIPMLTSYWKEGGTIQWFAQVCREEHDAEIWRDWMKKAIDAGAAGLYIHGGLVDFWHTNDMHGHFNDALAMMRDAKRAAGFAGHRADAHEWIRDNLDVDFQMCSYYNPTDRSQDAMHQTEGEKWDDADRETMIGVIGSLPKPAVHYKVLAAANKPIDESFERLGRALRAQDVVCLGMHLKDDPELIVKNVALIDKMTG